MVCPYDGILLNNKKEPPTDTCLNLDESQKHAKGEKPESKDYIPHDSMCMQYPEMVHLY